MLPILCLSLSHKKVPIHILETFTLKDIRSSLQMLIEMGAEECAIVQTCHRVEIYAIGKGIDGKTIREFLHVASGSSYPIKLHSDLFIGEDAVRHLFYLASGLESVIIGENEILHQVSDSLKIAEECGSAKRLINALFRSAINTGRRVRRETSICRGSISIGNIVIKAILDEFNILNGKKLVIIGAGKIGCLIAKTLPKKGPVTVFIANRTYSRALKLAAEVSGKAVRFDKLRETIREADAIICATSSPHLILMKEDFESISCDRRYFVIDVSNPRGVDERIKDLGYVKLIDLDHLITIAKENIKTRKEAIERAKEIADASLVALVKKLELEEKTVCMEELMRWAEGRRKKSIEVAFRRCDFNLNQKRIIEEFSYALMRDLLLPFAKGKLPLGDGMNES